MVDTDLTKTLAELGIDAMSQRALVALPMVRVAWADGAVQDAERTLILRLAEERLELSAEGALLVSDWLRYRPSDSYFDRGLAVLQALGTDPGGISDVDLSDVIELSRKVAKASGGLFGFGAVSRSETATIEHIVEALGGRQPATFGDFDSASRGSQMTVSLTLADNTVGGVLVWESDGERQKSDVVGKGLIVGSGPDADVRVLPDGGVADAHCKVFMRRRRFYVDDLDTESGTYVNGERVGERRLLGGETLRVGSTSVTFKMSRGVADE